MKQRPNLLYSDCEIGRLQIKTFAWTLLQRWFLGKRVIHHTLAEQNLQCFTYFSLVEDNLYFINIVIILEQVGWKPSTIPSYTI